MMMAQSYAKNLAYMESVSGALSVVSETGASQ